MRALPSLEKRPRPLVRAAVVVSLCMSVSVAGSCADERQNLRRQQPSAKNRVLLRDDFNGPVLDASRWVMPIGDGTFLGRTQLRPPSSPVEIRAGVLRLQIDTFNPTAVVSGDSFWGTEIVSRQAFERGGGLSLRASVRLVPPIRSGTVASVFSYVTRAGTRDEIDFELVTQKGRERLLTNIFDSEPFDVPGQPRFVSVTGLRLTTFNEFEVVWLPDLVQWKVNGRLVREEEGVSLNEAMSVRLNFWVPGSDFLAAYDRAPARDTPARHSVLLL